jgi:hypothetical protein
MERMEEAMKLTCLAVVLLMFGFAGMQFVHGSGNTQEVTGSITSGSRIPWGGAQEYRAPATYYFYFAP